MKANELMIGDWVAYRRDFPDRVNAIAIGGHAVSLERDSWQQMSCISPIPITPEILEKNGFALLYSSVPGGSPEDRRRKRVYTYELQGTGIHVNDIPEFGHIEIVGLRNVKIMYIHELQHALRMLGVQKEIIL